MSADSGPEVFKFGAFAVNLSAGELRRNGSRIRLQEKPLRVLEVLLEHQGQMVSRDELKRRLWPEDTFVDFETGLNTAVSKLRDALSDSAEKPRYIETIPRRGYRFLCPIEASNGRGAAVAVPTASPTQIVPTNAAQPDLGVTAPPAVESGLPSVTRAKSRTRLWISAAAAVAVIAGVAYWLTNGHPAFSFRSRDSVLITDFENQTGDPRFNNALDTAFTVSIQQSRYANVFPRTRLDSVLARMEKPANQPITPALGREICQRENVKGLIAASITRTGQQYALTAQLIDPQTGETVRSYTERSYGEDHILDALDVLSKEIREALGESLYQIHQANKPLPDVTTSSLSALQQFADASALWHQGKPIPPSRFTKQQSAAIPDSPWLTPRLATRTTAISTTYR